MILNDVQILELCRQGMITPYQPESIKRLENGARAISFGISSFGYDLQVGDTFKIVKKGTAPIDPKQFDESMLEDLEVFSDETGRYVLIPPNSFALAHSLEYWKIPEDVVTVALAKSTYARCGIIPNVTPFEPGWEGIVTLEISNTTDRPAKVYAGEGLVQVMFFRGERPSQLYSDRSGKYQKQQGITTARV